MRMLFRLARAWELGLQARQKTKITSSHRQLRNDVVIGIWRVRRAVHVRIMGIFVAQLKVCDAPFQRLEVRLHAAHACVFVCENGRFVCENGRFVCENGRFVRS
jgi:hypothetical protein